MLKNGPAYPSKMMVKNIKCFATKKTIRNFTKSSLHQMGFSLLCSLGFIAVNKKMKTHVDFSYRAQVLQKQFGLLFKSLQSAPRYFL
jgi:hypothetical protein